MSVASGSAASVLPSAGGGSTRRHSAACGGRGATGSRQPEAADTDDNAARLLPPRVVGIGELLRE